jgi:hypothetical protein
MCAAKVQCTDSLFSVMAITSRLLLCTVLSASGNRSDVMGVQIARKIMRPVCDVRTAGCDSDHCDNGS